MRLGISRGRSRTPGLVDDTLRRPTFIAWSGRYGAGALNIPAGTQDGDMMVMLSVHRNGTMSIPAGWTFIFRHDNYTNENGYGHYKVADGEGPTVTISATGYSAHLIGTFRYVNTFLSYDYNAKHPETAPQLFVPKNGLLVCGGHVAYQGVNWTKFWGLTTVQAYNVSTNAKILMSYIVAEEDGLYGEYVPELPIAWIYDGYSSIAFT